ncbi:MAG: NADH-quinone oxidoreductase subunit NuoH [Anaerolineae bacterium]|nr:MAG: NADH-quinone oxidoreductase subunit NuoH [Anaerolineae bacterium]
MMDPLVALGDWLLSLAAKINLPPAVSQVILYLLGVSVIATVALVITIFNTWLERKIAARLQDRIGPNRVGPWGLLQPIADAIKMLTKEDTTPAAADKVAYNIAPILAVVSVLLIWAVIPFTSVWYGTKLNVAVLYIAAVGSFGVLAVLMAGWSSNNKYALLGAFRAVSQLISYEVPLFLSLLVPVLLARSMDISVIVEKQGSFLEMFVVAAPLAALLFFISSVAEVGRTPFDLLEAESEIVAGYHIEYSGFKFGMFQAGEFMHTFTIGALTALLFLGGWQGPLVDQYPILGLVYFMGKSFAVYFVTMWMRSTLPRIRIDHMQALNWKILVPVALVLLMLTPLVDYFTKDLGVLFSAFPGSPGELTLTWRTAALLLTNLVVGIGALDIIRRTSKRNTKARQRFPERAVARPPKEEAA